MPIVAGKLTKYRRRRGQARIALTLVSENEQAEKRYQERVAASRELAELLNRNRRKLEAVQAGWSA